MGAGRNEKKEHSKGGRDLVGERGTETRDPRGHSGSCFSSTWSWKSSGYVLC